MSDNQSPTGAQAEVQSLRTTIADLENTVAELRTDNDRPNSVIARLRQSENLAQEQSRLAYAKLQNTIYNHDSAISTYNTQIAQLTTEAAANESTITLLKAKLSELTALPVTHPQCQSCTDRDGIIADLEDKIVELNAHIRQLDLELSAASFGPDPTATTAAADSTAFQIKQQFHPPDYQPIPDIEHSVGLKGVKVESAPALVRVSDFRTWMSTAFLWLRRYEPRMIAALLTAESINTDNADPFDKDNFAHQRPLQQATDTILRMMISTCQEATDHISVFYDGRLEAGHAWYRLCLAYNRTTFITVARTAAPLLTAAQSTDTPMVHLSKIEHAATKLRLMLPNCISDQLLVVFVLFSVLGHSDYEDLLKALLASYVDSLPPLSAIRYHLNLGTIISPQKPVPKPSPNPFAGAAMPQLPPDLPDKPPKGDCYLCPGHVHWAWNCPNRTPQQ